MRRLVTLVVALAFALLALGLAVLPLQAPLFTRALSARFSLAQEAGLSSPRMLAVAEQVRAFVVEGEGSLPDTVEGRPGFDGSAVEHLIDVREVLRGARTVTVLLAALLAAWTAVQLSRGRQTQVARTLRTAAVATIGLPLLGAGAGFVSFDALFTAFHGLFFAGGTWVFPAESLLIQTFPEPFWMGCGVAWAALVALLALAYWLAGMRLGGARGAATNDSCSEVVSQDA